MRRGLLLLALLFLACSKREPGPVHVSAEPAVMASAVAANHREAAKPVAAPVAFVELFTSQGCSSCPPADENLTRIAHEARAENRAVIALSFHVDYWNYLGWRDPFSDARFSQRQQRHARRLGSNVYTPQMVVGGREQLLGSRASDADQAIERALTRPMTHRVIASAEGGKIAVKVSGPAARGAVAVALTHSAPGVTVARGENAGRTLSHVNVVRAFEQRTLELPGAASFELDAPTDDGMTVVAWVEDERTGFVLGATAGPAN